MPTLAASSLSALIGPGTYISFRLHTSGSSSEVLECGSGGGGYILGFTQDLTKAKSLLADHQLEVVYTF